MINYEEFVNANKSIIIAPAGYGKTHTISESLKYTEGKQLILTHTHAGISSIKTKLKKTGISSKNYNVETITSFAQKFVMSFYIGDDIPEQENTNEYYPFIIDKATELFRLGSIKDIISISYAGLFVDEYQDCTYSQHKLILELSNILPTHILGDFLQGIFNFKPVDDPIIDLSDSSKLSEFYTSFQELDEPWRWKIGGNEPLGLELKDIRLKLIEGDNIDLTTYNSIEFVNTDNIYDRGTSLKIHNIINTNNSLLIIDPISTRQASRIKFIQMYNTGCVLLESIDDKSFYELSKLLDTFTSENIYKNIINISDFIFSKTEFKKWFNTKNNRLINKTSDDKRIISDSLKNILTKLESDLSYLVIAELLILISKIPGIKIYRKDLFYSLIKSLKNSEIEAISVYESMINSRNLIRRTGKRVEGKCIGTTLLTKGLEFDTVLILNAHKFDCPKHLYVAMTRASNKLIIYSENNILSPY